MCIYVNIYIYIYTRTAIYVCIYDIFYGLHVYMVICERKRTVLLVRWRSLADEEGLGSHGSSKALCVMGSCRGIKKGERWSVFRLLWMKTIVLLDKRGVGQ